MDKTAINDRRYCGQQSDPHADPLIDIRSAFRVDPPSPANLYQFRSTRRISAMASETTPKDGDPVIFGLSAGQGGLGDIIA